MTAESLTALLLAVWMAGTHVIRTGVRRRAAPAPCRPPRPPEPAVTADAPAVEVAAFTEAELW